MEKISVVVPVYNGGKFVKNCIEMLLSQKEDIYEIVLVNDGSVDSTEDIILSFGSDKIKYCKQENKGVSEARNKGLALATGDFVVFCDVDDTIEEGFFRDIVSVVESKPVDLVCFAKSSVGKVDYENDVCNIPKRAAILSVLGEDSFPYSSDYFMMAVWSKVFRRSILVEKGICFDKRISFGEDTLFMLEFLDKCGRVDCVHRGYYSYVQNENSACKKGGKESDFEGFYAFLDGVKNIYSKAEYYREDSSFESMKNIFVYRMGEIYIGRYRRGSSHTAMKERKEKVRKMSKSLKGFSRGVSLKKRIKNELIFLAPKMYLKCVNK